MKRTALTLLSIFFFSCVVSAATAEGKAPSQIGQEKKVEAEYLSADFNAVENPVIPKAPNIFETIIKLVISLLFVIGLIYVLMIALKFFYVRASIPLRSEGVVKILAKEYLEDKKSVYVVEDRKSVV